MRAALNLVSILALAAGLASCTESSQAPQTAEATASTYSKSDAMNGFDKTLAQAKASLEKAMASPLTVPTPKDPGGGYTHERHKANFTLMYDAGQLYQLTGEKKYAEFAGQAMLDYAEVYPSWGIHPAKKEQSPGRMFWQNLNESMFLLHVGLICCEIWRIFFPSVRLKHSTKCIITEHGQRLRLV